MSHSENTYIKVLIVDDSALVRALLKEVLESDSRISVVASAKDAYEARELIKKHNPDVLTLDIEMPKMNGITFLKNLMRLRPMPVIMISTLTQEGAPATLSALEIGAVDFLAKPKSEGAHALERYRDLIVEKVVAASKANVRYLGEKAERASEPTSQPKMRTVASSGRLKAGFLCAIGASTGGTEAIKDVISVLPENSPAIVVTQHIPAAFSGSFARRVDGQSAVKVYEAEDNQLIKAGCVYIAPGHSHLRVENVGGQYICRLDEGELVNRHRPAVEVLFDSVIEAAGSHSMGVLLTGMGNDGSEALLRMRESGCMTIAQDEESSVVWGMPGVAVKLNAAQKVLSLKDIAGAIINEASK